MKLQTHTCAAEGCQHVITSRLLMCADHWRMVPVAMRREILKQLRLRRMAADLSDRIDAAADYRRGVAAAVAAVKEKQERKAQAGLSGSLFNN